MDEIARYNAERWRRLVEANAVFTQPKLDLDVESARQVVDPDGHLGDLKGKRVLCLAAGGGQQSVAFALLGAHVTVVDLAEGQLERDREAAAHYRVSIQTLQADMRDLSALESGAFDLVWQPYSLNFVPDVSVVFAQVARRLRQGGMYYFACANPYFLGMAETDWNGEGYVLRHPYTPGAELFSPDDDWVYNRGTKPAEAIPGRREFRHAFSALINGLVAEGFTIQQIADSLDVNADPQAEPGTWDHFTAYAPPWLAFWATYNPSLQQRL
jgi:2-polyprenyl-3-methyl-5-hydroxy-6-metoxy-1,4-benzoquinol methylase